MDKISSFDLISGADINIDGIGVLHQPTLDEIRKLGYGKYTIYINTLLMDIDNYFRITNVSKDIIEITKSQVVMFDLLFLDDKGRVLLQDALSFFIKEQIIADVRNQVFVLFNEDGSKTGEINRDNYNTIQSMIKQINFIVEEPTTSQECQDPKIKAILEKFEQGRKAMAKSKKQNQDMNLTNILAAVSTFHNSYNLINIWSLTVFQLYDQFFRLNSKIQIDVFGFRWAAWGKEEFDFSTWYRELNQKK